MPCISGGRNGNVDGSGMNAETAHASETTHGGVVTQNGQEQRPSGSTLSDGTTSSVPKFGVVLTNAFDNGRRTCGRKSMRRTVASASAHSVQNDCTERAIPDCSPSTTSTTTGIYPANVVVEAQGPICTDDSYVMSTRPRSNYCVSRAIWAKHATAASAHISIQTVHRLGSNPVPCKRLAGEARPAAAFTAAEDIVSSARRRAAAHMGGSTRSVVGRTSSQDGGNQLLIYAGMIYGIKKTRFTIGGVAQDYATVVCSTWAQATQPAI